MPATSTPDPTTLAGILVLVVIAVGATVAILVMNARRRRAAGGADAAAADPADGPRVLWGLYVPGSPVQRMARSVAIGFVEIDPEETSRLVRSTDEGANWHVVPRERWHDAE